MKRSQLHLLILTAFAGILMQCNSTPEGTRIEGAMKNAGGTQVYLDKVVINQASNVLSKADVAADGSFRLDFPEGLDAGIYNLRIGAKRLNLVLDGSEKVVAVNGDLHTMQNGDITLEGSPSSQAYLDFFRSARNQRIGEQEVKTFVDTTQNPYTAAFVAFSVLRNNPQYLDIHRKAQERLAETYSQADMVKSYGEFIDKLDQQYQKTLASQRVRVGEPAPDITLPNPRGENMSLSDLRGKIVLLDFWASWCGPCRRENPNVVKVYKRYKDEGFEVFSVSLDGLDTRTKARLGNDPERIKQMADRSKQRWVQAIEQDNLIWDYHVSDLKKWESKAASKYGVTSIPRTFLIDREGNIAAINLRGAANIEAELKKLL
jgi:peroxiredoxin